MKRLQFRLIVFLFSILYSAVIVAVNTAPLQLLIADCQRLLSQSTEGTENGSYLIGSKQQFQTAITNAGNTLSNTTATQEELNATTDSLHNAYIRFGRQRYGIVNPNWSDNYWQFSSTTSQWGPYNVHDPAILKTDGYFYAFSTDAAWANTSAGIPLRRSRDLVNWEFRGWAFNGFPAEPSNWLLLQQPAGETKRAVTGLWAPYIMKVGLQYRLYYSAVFAGSGALIGLATSENIEGPWTQVGKVISTYDLPAANAIDPTVTIDKNGKHWMIYGSWSNGIYVFELNPTTGLKKDGTAPQLIAQNGPNNTWGWKSCMEGPEIIYNPTFKKYYLFFAQGSLGNVYHTRVARSVSPTGPFLDYFGVNVAYTSTSPKYPEIYPLLTYPYQFDNHPGWQGVSHVGVFNDGNNYYMMHQGRPSANAAMMVMQNRKITWTADGWPTVSPERFANPGIMPAITADSIVGNWEEIQLNELKDVAAGFAGRVTPVVDDTLSAWKFLNKSKMAVYKADGTYTYGTEAGSWKLSGDTLITTRLQKSFRAILSYDYDWENNRPTITYTGLRYDARSIWGKKSYARPSNNIILNPGFDDGLTNWLVDKAGGVFDEKVVANGINGNSYYVLCTTTSTNYWDHQLRWLFPVPKCGRYKVSFKVKAKSACILNFEIQDNSSIIPIIRKTFSAGPSASTVSFITQDVPTTSTLYTMNIAYGNLVSGNELWIDDVVVEELTNLCVGNYITNGNLTDGSNGWIYKTGLRFLGKMDVDSVNRINYNPTLHCKVTIPSTFFTDAMIKWSTQIPSGAKYVLEFSAKSTTGMDIVPRLMYGAAVFSALPQARISGDVSTYRYIFPEVTTAGPYTVEIDYGKSAAGSEVWMNNFSLRRCTGDCTNTEINNIASESLTIYPNPAKSYFEISSGQRIDQLSIFSIDGKMVRNYEGVSSGRIDVSMLTAGSYVVHAHIGKVSIKKLLLISK